MPKTNKTVQFKAMSTEQQNQQSDHNKQQYQYACYLIAYKYFIFMAQIHYLKQKSALRAKKNEPQQNQKKLSHKLLKQKRKHFITKKMHQTNSLTQKDGNANVTTYTYNGLNHRLTMSQPQARNHTYTTNIFGEILADIGPNGTITNTYNTLGQKTSVTAPDGFHEIYTYDLNDNLTSRTDSRGNTTVFGINDLDQITAQATDTYSQTASYDTLGNKLTDTNYNGITTTTSYNKANQPLTTTKAGIRQITNEYNTAGLLQTVIDAKDNGTVYQYDGQYQLKQTNLPETQVIKYSTNAFGDVLLQDNTGANDITKTYDQRRRLKTETNGEGETTSYEYDLNNNRTAVIKPDGTRYQYTYDEANRLTSIQNMVENIKTTYGYSTKDNLTSIKDAMNKTTTFTYDDSHRKKSKTYPDGKITTYGYDDNGNLTSVNLPNGVGIVYGYDVLNRQTSKHYADASGSTDVNFTLDGNGNIKNVQETIDTQTTSITATFDDFDRITSIKDHHDNILRFDYDLNGNRKILNDPKNTASTYVYDDLNRLATAVMTGTGSFNYIYNYTGILKKINYPTSGGEINFTYDNANRIDVITAKQSGANIATYDYDYDANGNRIKLTQSNLNGTEIISYTYDKADRLTQVIYPDVTVDYTLDKVGNRTQETINDGTTTITKTYSYNDRHQLTGVVGTDGLNVTYNYDDAGNQTQMVRNGQTTTFDYNPRQRVKTITQNSLPIHYKYDYLGNRIEKQSNGQTSYYTYDGTSLLYETNTIGNVLAKYHYGSDRILAETRGNQNSYIYHDALKTPIAISDGAGSIINRLDYDAFGNLKGEATQTPFPFGYTGYQHDKDTGLYYAKARYYNPEEGRFLREDPLDGDILRPPSLHRYNYASANPNSFVDPTGKGDETPHFYESLLGASVVDLNEGDSYTYAVGAQIGDEFEKYDAMENSFGFVGIVMLDSISNALSQVLPTNIFKVFNTNTLQTMYSVIRNNCGNHGLCGSQSKYVRNAYQSYINNEAENFGQLGTADHTNGDSYYHITLGTLGTNKEMSPTPIIGHGLDGTSTDKAYRFFDSKRRKAFEERTTSLYLYAFRNNKTDMSFSEFQRRLGLAVSELIDQNNKLLDDSGPYPYTHKFNTKVDSNDEYAAMRKILNKRGYNNITKPEDFPVAHDITKLLGSMGIARLRAMVISINPRVEEHKLNSLSKKRLINYLNAKFDRYQAKSRDYILDYVSKYDDTNESVKESAKHPGVEETSK